MTPVILQHDLRQGPELGKLMANKDFRIAMSYAINRKQINESAFLGPGEPRQAVPKKGIPTTPATSTPSSTPSTIRTRPTSCWMRSA